MSKLSAPGVAPSRNIKIKQNNRNKNEINKSKTIKVSFIFFFHWKVRVGKAETWSA